MYMYVPFISACPTNCAECSLNGLSVQCDKCRDGYVLLTDSADNQPYCKGTVYYAFSFICFHWGNGNFLFEPTYVYARWAHMHRFASVWM